MQKDDFKKTYNNLPDSPGVYFFKKGSKILYVGRATSIRDRVQSYFSKDIINTRGGLILEMVKKADGISFQKTDSVLEAIILEANLIKKYKPYYNTKAKDDRSFNYVIITKEDFPQILTLRDRDLKLKTNSLKLKAFFGPFPNAEALKEAIKFIRKIFPFRDEKCNTAQFFAKQKIGQNAGVKPCFNYHIGLCPGTCTHKISKKEYAKTIRNIIALFEGKKDKVIKNLQKEMTALAKNMQFEKANEIKKKIFALNHIRDIAFIKKDIEENIKIPYTSILQNTSIRKSEVFRVEAYDIAHLGGKEAVGAMIVFTDKSFKKEEYKVFNIKQAQKSDDFGALQEILTRRLQHKEWQYPEIILIDGGEAHRQIAEKTIQNFSSQIEVLSVVKGKKHKARFVLPLKKYSKAFINNLFKINSEAHRFVLGRHRKKRSSVLKDVV